MKQSEADILKAVTDLLTYEQNTGRLVFFRLNAGAFPTQSGGWAKGVPAGTADLLVIKKWYPIGGLNKGETVGISSVMFLEVKSEKGKQTEKQREFQDMVEKLDCEYCIVRSVDEVIELIGGE